MILERINTGLTRQAAAALLGISEFTLRAYETGYRKTPPAVEVRAGEVYAKHAETLAKLLRSPIFVMMAARRSKLVEELLEEYQNKDFLEEDQKPIHRALIKALESELAFIDELLKD